MICFVKTPCDNVFVLKLLTTLQCVCQQKLHTSIVWSPRNISLKVAVLTLIHGRDVGAVTKLLKAELNSKQPWLTSLLWFVILHSASSLRVCVIVDGLVLSLSPGSKAIFFEEFQNAVISNHDANT